MTASAVLSRPWERLSALLRAPWLWRAVVLPFIATRLALLLVGWYAAELRIDSDYPNKAVTRLGWENSPYRWLDIWGRWDSNIYLSIVTAGYQPSPDPSV
jgi:hypothetical protein